MSTATPLDRIGVGIDTARYGHRVAFLRPDRQLAAPPITVLESDAGYQALRERLEQLQRQHPQAHFYVRIDAAGQYAANLEHFLRGLDLPSTVSIGEPKRNKDYQKAHFPKRTSDDTESQAMARFAVVEQPAATPAPRPEMVLLREVAGRLQAQVKQTTQATNRLHNLLARVFPELATLTNDISAGWVLHLLDKYPTAERISQARLGSLEKIPYLAADQAQALHQAAQRSVGSLRGAVAETLVRDLVGQVRHAEQAEQNMRQLLTTAFAELPASGHRQLATISGIGDATAAVLTAKIVDIDRLDTPEQLVGYFGVFPDQNSSGVDKQGKPLPPGTLRMSHKGNDLARSYLWNAARSALTHNPAVRALYRRLRAKGKRGDVAIGHCMRKLLHLVFAVWKTDRPFDKHHFPWEPPSDTAVPMPDATEPAPTPTAAVEPARDPAVPMPDATEPAPTPTAAVEPARDPAVPMPDATEPAPTPTAAVEPARDPAVPMPDATEPAPTPTAAVEPARDPAVPMPAATAPAPTPTATATANGEAVGHPRAMPAQPVVTTATSSVAPPPAPVKPPPAAPAVQRPCLDFAFLRAQLTMEQVLAHLGLLPQLHGRGQQRRGPCPVHGQAGDRSPTFSVHLGKQVFQCFQADCGVHGNVLDLWAALHHLPLYEAALHLAATFHLPRNREEEPVK